MISSEQLCLAHEPSHICCLQHHYCWLPNRSENCSVYCQFTKLSLTNNWVTEAILAFARINYISDGIRQHRWEFKSTIMTSVSLVCYNIKPWQFLPCLPLSFLAQGNLTFMQAGLVTDITDILVRWTSNSDLLSASSKRNNKKILSHFPVSFESYWWWSWRFLGNGSMARVQL